MTRSIHSAALAAAAILSFCLSLPGHAVVPDSLSYQGYLADLIGTPVDADVNITFRLYTVDSGGTALWTATQLVPVANGLFSVELGDPPFPVGAFDTPLWLSIEVESDGEMFPRRAVNSVGFAFVADDALTLTGQSAGDLDQSFHVGDTGNPHSVTTAQTGAATAADIANLQTQLDAALATIATMQSDLVNETNARISADEIEGLRRSDADTIHDTAIAAHDTLIAAHDTLIAGNDFHISSLQSDLVNETNARISAIAAHDTLIAGLQSDFAVLQANSVLQLDGLLTLIGNTALFDGVNVQVVNGTGSTTTFFPNGLGNLIVGYDAPRASGSDKSGSHNLIVGDNHNYLSYGGLVAGFENTVSGPWASVTGGLDNTASDPYSSVTGGQENTARYTAATVAGGRNNVSYGHATTVLGGGGSAAAAGNTAFGSYTAILGGSGNNTSGIGSVVSGGVENIANGNNSVVSAGRSNQATAYASAIGGGYNNKAMGNYSSVAGGGGGSPETGNTAFGKYSAILGGASNVAGDPALLDPDIGTRSTISGGFENNASGWHSSVTGGRYGIASGFAATVLGGGGPEIEDRTLASGDYAAVIGLYKRRVFVTQGAFSGNIGGVAAADNICQAEADAAGLPGTYFAWLSEYFDGPEPANRFTRSIGPYVKDTGTDLVTVAENWDELTDPPLLSNIDTHADGAYSGQLSVWTATNQWGEGLELDCGDWFSDDAGAFGWTGHTQPDPSDSDDWTRAEFLSCNTNGHLYCFQQ